MPDITTSATVKATGESSVEAAGTVTISDTVEYSGVEPGLEYKITGRLMSKSTGNEVTGTYSELTFTPEKASGTLLMEYDVNSAELSGDTVVAFEKMYYRDSLIATHEDINNKAQSVNITKPKVPENNDNGPDMGDGLNFLILLCGVAISLVFGAIALLRRVQ